MSEPLSPEVQIVFAELQQNRGIFEMGMRATLPSEAQLQGSRVFSLYGGQAIEFTLVLKNTYTIKRAFLAGGRVITLDFISKVADHAQRERYFNSFKAPGISGVQIVTPIPMNPGQPPPMQAHQVPPGQPQNIPMQVPQQAGPTQTPQADTDVDPSIDQRKVWKYKDAPAAFGENHTMTGSFVKARGNQWKEERLNDSPLLMQESGRTSEYIELSRSNGRFQIRLYADHSTYCNTNNGQFKRLYPGKWE